MRRSILRLVAPFLVPFLVADPHTAIAFCSSGASTSHRQSLKSRFEQETLARSPDWMCRSLFKSPEHAFSVRSAAVGAVVKHRSTLPGFSKLLFAFSVLANPPNHLVGRMALIVGPATAVLGVVIHPIFSIFAMFYMARAVQLLFRGQNVGTFLRVVPSRIILNLNLRDGVIISRETPIAELHLRQNTFLQRKLPGERRRYRTLRFMRTTYQDFLELAGRLQTDDAAPRQIQYFRLESPILSEKISGSLPAQLEHIGLTIEPASNRLALFYGRLVARLDAHLVAGVKATAVVSPAVGWISREDLIRAIPFLQEKIQEMDEKLKKAVESRWSPLQHVMETTRIPAWLAGRFPWIRRFDRQYAVWFTHADIDAGDGSSFNFSGTKAELAIRLKAREGMTIFVRATRATYRWNSHDWVRSVSSTAPADRNPTAIAA